MTLVFMVRLGVTFALCACTSRLALDWADARDDAFLVIVLEITLRAFQLATIAAVIGCVWLA